MNINTFVNNYSLDDMAEFFASGKSTISRWKAQNSYPLWAEKIYTQHNRIIELAGDLLCAENEIKRLKEELDDIKSFFKRLVK